MPLHHPKDREASGKPNKKKLKKAAAGNMTANNFGSILDISKLKRASRVVIGWRVRLTFQTCVGKWWFGFKIYRIDIRLLSIVLHFMVMFFIPATY